MEIAIVEDNKRDVIALSEYLKRYESTHGCEALHISVFNDALDLVSDYRAQFDIIFFDIEMPHLNGMDGARKVRELDAAVAIVFVTNLAHYAIKGYEVDAVDFLVKPVEYASFEDKFKRALKYCESRKSRPITVDGENGELVRVYSGDVFYIEKSNGVNLYKCSDKTYRKREALYDTEKELGNLPFVRINSGCLVNMSYIDEIAQTTITVRGEVLPLSRRRRKEVIDTYMRFLGGKR